MQTVLIVEDEKLIRQGIRVMIQRSGVPVENIIECGNGLMALDVLKNQKVDVMFTDIRMPKMDGIELVRAMQTLPHQPLTVAVSGYDDFSYAVEMMRGGVREYLLKPVARESLKAILEKLELELVTVREEEERKILSERSQLRRMLEPGQIPEEELRMIQEQIADPLYQSYEVCCFAKMKEPVAEKKRVFLMLGEMPEGSICVVESDSSSLLLKNELSDACVGISLVHSGAGELRQAYLEAVQARKEAFCGCVHVCRFSGDSHSSLFERMTKTDAPSYADGSQPAREGEIYRDSSLRRTPAIGGKSDAAEPTADEINKLVQTIGTDRYEDCRYQATLFLQKVKRGVYTSLQMEHYLKTLLDQIQTAYAAVLKIQPARDQMEAGMQRVQQEQSDEKKLSDMRKRSDLQKRLTDIYSYRNLDEYAEALNQWIDTVHERADNRSDEFRNRQKLEKAIRYIRDNYSRDLNMAVVSNHVSMNYSLFSQEFKQYTGENFVSYLRSLRMEEAKRLLAQTDLRVGEISQRAGYENEKHFMKTFKAVYGVSPTEFRKNVEYTENP